MRNTKSAQTLRNILRPWNKRTDSSDAMAWELLRNWQTANKFYQWTNIYVPDSFTLCANCKSSHHGYCTGKSAKIEADRSLFLHIYRAKWDKSSNRQEQCVDIYRRSQTRMYYSYGDVCLGSPESFCDPPRKRQTRRAVAKYIKFLYLRVVSYKLAGRAMRPDSINFVFEEHPCSHCHVEIKFVVGLDIQWYPHVCLWNVYSNVITCLTFVDAV